MKVLAVVDREKFIVEISQTEVEKVMDKYYAKPPFPDLKVGDMLDLSLGYNFRSDIRSVCNEMRDAMKKFDSARNTLLQFATMVNSQGDEN